MAEVIGVVASGISIAQIAGEVASSVLKIKIFWDQVKAAPDEINHLLREVESFSLILEHIRDDLARNTLPDFVFDNDCMRQSLELCRTGAAELQELAGDLAAKLEGKSGMRMKMNATKIVLKKDDIQNSKRRLKGAIRLLSLAYQCHTNAMIRLQPDIILARLSTTMVASSAQRIVDTEYQPTSTKEQTMQTTSSNSTDLVTQCYTHWTASPSWLRFLFGSLEYNKRKIMRRNQEQELHKARYKLPEFISLKTWDVTFYKSLSDWTVNMRTYRTLHYHAPIFNAIRNDDILLVQDLLSSKAAFVTDVNTGGSTLLHEAAENMRFEICELLISQGADVCVHDNFQWTPLEYSFMTYFPPFYSGDTDKRQDIVRLLVEAGANDGLNHELDLLERFVGQKKTFQYLQQQTYPPYYSLTLSERLRIAFSLSLNGEVGADTIKLSLTRSWIDEEMATFVDENGNTLILIVIQGFVNFCIANFPIVQSEHEIFVELVKDWHMLIREVINAGASTRCVDGLGRSILHHMMLNVFDNSYVELEDALSFVRRIISFWLLDLEEAGVDLAQYGAHEHAVYISVDKQYFFAYWPRRLIRTYFQREEVAVHLINFTYGPRPEDWTFWFSEPTDIFAGEFWEMVERPKENEELELPMPGAWIDGA